MKKILMLFIFFSFFTASNACSHTGLVYAYPAVNNFNECRSKATSALKQTGYTVTSAGGGYITIGSKRNIKANIACSVANKHGVAFIILTAPLGVNLGSELGVVSRKFFLLK